ncbi:hypothetical protein M3Y94_00466500 [Aphelenchoides besseyi]|nr:hypothetical protein M3Y94_00466500 [Aphelenchoides besseyi]KAI6229165.1 hypothetical protein M3Y95_00502600 [Aphelenchoides besseyi]
MTPEDHTPTADADQRPRASGLIERENYKLDPNIKREVLNPDVFVDKLQRAVSFQIATIDDEPNILEFLLHEHARQEPMASVSGLIKKEFEHAEAAYRQAIRGHLSDGLTIMIVDNGYLCGVSFSSVRELRQNKTSGQTYQFKEDYGKELKSLPIPAPRLNRILTFKRALEDAIPYFLPDDVRFYVCIDFLSVHSDYAHCTFGKSLVQETFKRTALLGISYVCIVCTSAAALKIAIQLLLHPATHLEFSRFVCNGRQVFPDKLTDGGTGATLFVNNVNEFVSVIPQ